MASARRALSSPVVLNPNWSLQDVPVTAGLRALTNMVLSDAVTVSNKGTRNPDLDGGRSDADFINKNDFSGSLHFFVKVSSWPIADVLCDVAVASRDDLQLIESADERLALC